MATIRSAAAREQIGYVESLARTVKTECLVFIEKHSPQRGQTERDLLAYSFVDISGFLFLNGILQEILDIPCNQFGAQAPGTDAEIHNFCTLHYNTPFPQMRKSDVNGENQLPLYAYLKSQKGFEGFGEHPFKDLLEKKFAEQDPDWAKTPDIKWNFTKFVVDREGNVVARFEPTADMGEVEDCIKALL